VSFLIEGGDRGAGNLSPRTIRGKLGFPEDSIASPILCLPRSPIKYVTSQDQRERPGVGALENPMTGVIKRVTGVPLERRGGQYKEMSTGRGRTKKQKKKLVVRGGGLKQVNPKAKRERWIAASAGQGEGERGSRPAAKTGNLKRVKDNC